VKYKIFKTTVSKSLSASVQVGPDGRLS